LPEGGNLLAVGGCSGNGGGGGGGGLLRGVDAERAERPLLLVSIGR